jgi:hypothetical protein
MDYVLKIAFALAGLGILIPGAGILWLLFLIGFKEYRNESR